MARRNGRPGDYLMTDSYYGFTRYASELKRDYWGEYASRPLKRNLQEVASPLNDPQPVPNYTGPNYEISATCLGETAPVYVGDTTVPTNRNNAAAQALALFPGIGQASIGCSFKIG